MLYDLEQVRAHYHQLVERKSGDYCERFDYLLLDSRPLVRDLVEKMFDRLFVEPAKTLVDLGCGTAFYYPLLARHAQRLVGVDVSVSMLELACRLILEKDLPNCGVLAASARALPFADASVDAVTSWDFLHHAPDLPAVIREIARILEPGGRYLVIEPNIQNPSIMWYHTRRRSEWGLWIKNQFRVVPLLRRHFDVRVHYDNTIVSFLNDRTLPLWRFVDRLTSVRPFRRLAFRYIVECRRRP